MHGITVFHYVDGMGFGGFLALFFQVNNVSRLQCVFFMEVVVFHQLLPADVKLLAQHLEGVSVARHDISYIVGNVHLMRIGQPSTSADTMPVRPLPDEQWITTG